ncbi:MAG TPA: hypothetical protein VHC22_24505 [Pirellulales bacterium]|nr:hypothetical protein [Pirellulales bacterium]
MTDETPLDDRLPQQPEPAPETDIEAYRRLKLLEQGLIERNGIRFHAETDWFTVSGLRAMLKETRELLHEVTGQRDAIFAEYETLSRIAADALANATRLEAEVKELQRKFDSLKCD